MERLKQLAIVLSVKIVSGDTTLEDRRLITKQALDSFNLSLEDRSLLKDICLKHGYLSSASSEAIFATTSRAN